MHGIETNCKTQHEVAIAHCDGQTVRKGLDSNSSSNRPETRVKEAGTPFLSSMGSQTDSDP